MEDRYMKEKSRNRTEESTRPQQAFQFEDEELRSTLEEYMREENKNGSNFWNFSTITGLVMVFVAMTVMVQTFLGGTFGFTSGVDLSNVLNVLPLIGGGLIALVGFGFVSSEKKKRKSVVTAKGSKYQRTGDDPIDAFLYPEGKKSDRSSSFREKTESKETGSKKSFSAGYDSYAMAQNKRLFKSRTDKKLSGVCGGLAKYFGISSTMVRLIFAIATIFGYGGMILIYLALAIALPKEPIDLLDDF
jgi:phage shock protein C